MAHGAHRDLEALACAFWHPIRAYLAARLRCREVDAEPLSAEAFAWLLGSGQLAQEGPAEGSFRCFLKKALARLTTEPWRRTQVANHGGCVDLVVFDESGEPVDPDRLAPERAFDDAWRRELLARADARLQRELQGRSRAVHWALFRSCCGAEGAVNDPAALAAQHGIPAQDVAKSLHHIEKCRRAILRDLVADTVCDAASLQSELRWLFGQEAGAAAAP